MIVKELIERLNKFDPNKKVVVTTENENPIGGGLDIINIFEIAGSNTEEDNAVYLVED